MTKLFFSLGAKTAYGIVSGGPAVGMEIEETALCFPSRTLDTPIVEVLTDNLRLTSPCSALGSKSRLTKIAKAALQGLAALSYTSVAYQGRCTRDVETRSLKSAWHQTVQEQQTVTTDFFFCLPIEAVD